MSTLLWRESHTVRWYVLLTVGAAGLTLSTSINLLIPVAAVFAVFLFVAATYVSPERRLGVGVAGAIAAVILFPTLNTPVPPFAGMAVGGLWAIVLTITARRRAASSLAYNLFSAVLLLGVASSLVLHTLPWLAITISIFTILIGYCAGLMNQFEWALVQRTIIYLGLIEAALCAVETFVLGARLTGSSTGGPHPILEDMIRAEGTLGHPLVAGMVMLAALALTQASTARGSLKCIASSILLIGIFACGSSSIYIAALLTLTLRYIGTGSIGARAFKYAVAAACSLYVLFVPSLLEPVVSDVGGVNSVHRFNSIIAFPRLLTDRPLEQALLGSGWGSTKQNYQAGYLINDNFYAVDNQFTTVMMATGVFGVTFFLIAVILCFRQVHPGSRGALGTLLFVFFSFDVLSWASTAALFIILATHHRREGQGTSPAEDQETQQDSRQTSRAR